MRLRARQDPPSRQVRVVVPGRVPHHTVLLGEVLHSMVEVLPWAAPLPWVVDPLQVDLHLWVVVLPSTEHLLQALVMVAVVHLPWEDLEDLPWVYLLPFVDPRLLCREVLLLDCHHMWDPHLLYTEVLL